MFFSLITALVICAVYFTLCGYFRNKLKSRYRFNAVAGVVTVVVWIVYLL